MKKPKKANYCRNKDLPFKTIGKLMETSRDSLENQQKLCAFSKHNNSLDQIAS